MSPKQKAKVASLAEELRGLYDKHRSLDPVRVVSWAKAHPGSTLHSRFQWDDSKAAQQYRLWQARELITSVSVVYPDDEPRQLYVSLTQDRGKGGYVSMVDAMSSPQRRKSLLAQALDDLNRIREKYRDLTELASVFAALKRVRRA